MEQPRDPRAVRAQACHQGVAASRVERDALVRELRAEDPVRWTYKALAVEVGCSPELIYQMVTGRTGRPRTAKGA